MPLAWRVPRCYTIFTYCPLSYSGFPCIQLLLVYISIYVVITRQHYCHYLQEGKTPWKCFQFMCRFRICYLSVQWSLLRCMRVLDIVYIWWQLPWVYKGNIHYWPPLGWVGLGWRIFAKTIIKSEVALNCKTMIDASPCVVFSRNQCYKIKKWVCFHFRCYEMSNTPYFLCAPLLICWLIMYVHIACKQ